MNPNIRQHITPRRAGHHTAKKWSSRSQRGSISSTTLTVTLSLIALVGISALGFIYLGQVLSTAKQGTDVQALEEKIMELHEQRRELELEEAQLRSIETIEREVEGLSLISAGKVTYLATSPDQVASLD